MLPVLNLGSALGLGSNNDSVDLIATLYGFCISFAVLKQNGAILDVSLNRASPSALAAA